MNKVSPKARSQPIPPTQWRHLIKTIPGMARLRELQADLESWWFDLRHHVDTAPQLKEQKKRGWREDKINFHYVPTRPKWAHRALRHLPVEVRRSHTFVDFGSGKGRVLLMATKFGFKNLVGIELRKELHDQACENFRRFRGVEHCRMQSLCMEATQYEFPNEKLVLFFFNPFGGEAMEKVLGKLEASLHNNFRDVWVILHGSVCSDLADRSKRLNLEVVHRGYRIYRSIPG